MKIVAIIPARGGSKSIKNKNIYKIKNIKLAVMILFGLKIN